MRKSSSSRRRQWDSREEKCSRLLPLSVSLQGWGLKQAGSRQALHSARRRLCGQASKREAAACVRARLRSCGNRARASSAGACGGIATVHPSTTILWIARRPRTGRSVCSAARVAARSAVPPADSSSLSSSCSSQKYSDSVAGRSSASCRQRRHTRSAAPLDQHRAGRRGGDAVGGGPGGGERDTGAPARERDRLSQQADCALRALPQAENREFVGQQAEVVPRRGWTLGHAHTDKGARRCSAAGSQLLQDAMGSPR